MESIASIEKKQLPKNWEEHFVDDEELRVRVPFYFNTVTGEKQWEFPRV